MLRVVQTGQSFTYFPGARPCRCCARGCVQPVKGNFCSGTLIGGVDGTVYVITAWHW